MELSEVLKEIDIVEYISRYIHLEQKGDEWWGLSCFNDEKTPSFSVRKDPPVFYDYSSGIGGNLYTFIKYYHKCGSKNAIEIIKGLAGDSGFEFTTESNISAITSCKKYRKPIKTSKRSSVKKLPKDIMNRYYIDNGKTAIWTNEGIGQEALSKFDVRYDSFSNSIVYPIRSPSGDIVNIGGRTLDPEWKSKGKSKYFYFYSWGSIETIYGLFENIEDIKNRHEIILFEGCKSVLKANTWGINNCGAILTSHLNQAQMKLLARLGCDVVFALDKEVSVTNDRNINMLKQYVNVSYIKDNNNLIGEKDSPVDGGEEIFRRLYEGRVRYR